MVQPFKIQAAPSLPPRPTVSPLTTPEPPSPEGGWIVLRATRQDATPTQTRWTAVQWQDRQGDWHTVEDWQGTFDHNTDTASFKMWWVAPRDLAKGAFRWVLYQKRAGAWLGASDIFCLPRNQGETTYVAVPALPNAPTNFVPKTTATPEASPLSFAYVKK